MLKTTKLTRNAYLRLLSGGLAEQMSQRIMYSIIPALADPSQVALTGGAVDIKALRAAVEGRKDIIKYGVEAVVMELANYTAGEYAKNVPYLEAKQFAANREYEKAMDVAIEAFGHTDKWQTRFGGKPWEIIARTLRQIIRLDHSLNTLRTKPRTADNEQKEIELMKALIIEMNVFDGLAHNSDAIFSNLIELEHKDKSSDISHPTQRMLRLEKSREHLKKLLDAKELDSPIEVFKQINDTLKGSGDINKFKDWITKIRNHPDFFKNDAKLGKKLYLIYLRKALMTAISDLNSYRDSLSNQIKYFEMAVSDSKEFSFLQKAPEIFNRFIELLTLGRSEVLYLKDELAEHLASFARVHPEISDLEEITQINDELKQRIESAYHPLDRIFNQLQFSGYPRTELELRLIIDKGKEALSLLNKVSYILDAI